MTELLPCPFCGGEARETSPEERGDEYWRITCASCGARIGGTNRRMNREAWNTRAERTCEIRKLGNLAQTMAMIEFKEWGGNAAHVNKPRNAVQSTVSNAERR